MKYISTPVFLYYLLTSSVCFSSVTPGQLDIQRDLFIQAELALQEDRRPEYWGLLKQIYSYPLYPYLRYADLKKRIQTASPNEVVSFIGAYGDSPISAKLRTKWLYALAKNNQWPLFLKHYRHTGSKALMCLHETGKIQTLRHYNIASQLKTIWLTGRNLADECNELIDLWDKNKLITTDLVKQRIRLSLKKNNYKLTGYLLKKLSESERRRMEVWLKVYKNPKLLMDSKILKHKDASLLVGAKFSGLAWYHPEEAILFTKKMLNQKHVIVDEGKIIKILAITLARGFHPDAETWLNRVPDKYNSERVKKWKIRTALYKGQWEKVLAHFSQLSANNRSQSRWKYWRARAFNETGEGEKASLLFSKVALERSYEGFLSADKLNMAYAFNHKTLDVDDKFIVVLKNNIGMKRARELIRLKRFSLARSEWNRATAGFTTKQMASAAWLAYKWGWSHQTIVTLAGISEWDDLSLRFPVKHIEEIKKYTQSTIIDPALALAVIRQESAFQENALSRSNARGLMQLMPATAKQVAGQLKFKLSNLGELNRPEVNIQLGVFYLNHIKHQLMKHPVLAIAAYNAGKSRVQNWLSLKQGLPVDVWIETIPFKETRNYLRNILAYSVVYEKRLGLPVGKITDRMPPLPGIDTDQQLNI